MRKRPPIEQRTVTDQQLHNRSRGTTGGAGGGSPGGIPTVDNATIHRNTDGELAVKDGGIDTTQLADDAVTTAKIDAEAVTATELATDAVTNAKVANDAINTAEIVNDAVTNAKLANMATQTIKGRTTAGTGDPEDLTATQATAVLNAFVGDSGSGGTKGLVPAPAAGDAGKFLKGDGTWGTGGGGASAFTDLTDVPSDYTGHAGKLVQVTSGEDGLEFASALADLSIDNLTIDEQFILPGNATATFSTNQTDLNPTNLANASRVFLTIGATVTIYSLAGTADGRILYVYNIGTNAGILKKDDGSTGTASMRFILNHDVPLYPGEGVMLYYDANVSRWRVFPLYGVKIGSGGAEMVHRLDFGNTSTVNLSESNSNGVSEITADVNDGSITAAKLAPSLWQPLRATANQAVINSNTLTNSTYLQFSMAAGTNYMIRYYIIFDTTAAGDFKYDFTGPGSPTLVRSERLHVEAGSSSPARTKDTAYPGSTALTGTGTTFGYVQGTMLVQNGANAATFAFRFAQNSAVNDTGAIVLAGSYMEYLVA